MPKQTCCFCGIRFGVFMRAIRALGRARVRGKAAAVPSRLTTPIVNSVAVPPPPPAAPRTPPPKQQLHVTGSTPSINLSPYIDLTSNGNRKAIAPPPQLVKGLMTILKGRDLPTMYAHLQLVGICCSAQGMLALPLAVAP